MKVKALKSFAGQISMNEDEVRDIPDLSVVKDLLNAGYIEKIEQKKQRTKRIVEESHVN